ncbi:uncharacterized protein LOC129247256 [Anastrepha obliqua]|uniref:uncharacterized protein LOC129247256 n=1 Tax=Anastrepha obliqua TaxID=95512 RepID=UPI002409FBBF|nr:uncharacterized protein LOC129247256 [Anastrepha obliqua]
MSSSGWHGIKKKKKNKIDNDRIKIPKDIFEKALEVINDSTHVTWVDRNSDCSKPIHRSFENDMKGMRSADLSSKMFLARDCLLKRDVRNFAKTLAVINPSGGRLDCKWYPLCVKYGAICLAHNNADLLNVYLQSLVSSKNNEGTLEKYTKYNHDVAGN